MTHTDGQNRLLLLEATLLGVRAKLAELERDRSILMEEERRLTAEIEDLKEKAKPVDRKPEKPAAKKHPRKRQISPEARERIRAAQKRRWARIHAAEALAKERTKDTPTIQEAESTTIIVPVEGGKDLIPEEEEKK